MSGKESNSLKPSAEEISINNSADNQAFDVVISGGGLSGLLMALSLLNLGLYNSKALFIAIIEANDAVAAPESVFDERVLALSHASVSYLKSLGVWSYLAEYAQPIKDIHISDRSYYGKARIKAEEHGVFAVGYVVEMSKIGNALQQTLKHILAKQLHDNDTKASTLTWFTPDSIANIEWQKSSAVLTLASSKIINAKLLIGCDGAQSSCRKFANIHVTEQSYEQSALITNVATRLPHNHVAYERFTEHGPVAMLPLIKLNNEDSRCSLVWTLQPDEAEKMQKLSECDFKKALEQAFGYWLGDITKIGTRHVYPLSLVRAQEQIYHRMVLVGNASHTIHPIAGQGFNLGLRDVKELSNNIAESRINGKDIGGLNTLTHYANARKKDHDHIITLTDSLVTLFSNQLPPLVAGRNVALKVLNYVPSIKKSFVNKTMGY